MCFLAKLVMIMLMMMTDDDDPAMFSVIITIVVIVNIKMRKKSTFETYTRLYKHHVVTYMILGLELLSKCTVRYLISCHPLCIV